MLQYLSATIIVILISLYFYFTRTFNYWTKRNVAGPKPIPFFGNIKESALRRKVLGSVIQEIYNNFSDEKIVGIYRMTTPSLLIRDLDILKHIMIKDFDCFISRGVEFSKEGLGANLFHADSDTWQILRKRFTPMFTSGKLKNMFHLLNDCADKFMDYVSHVCTHEEEHDVYPLLQRYTKSGIAACAFGMDIDMDDINLEALFIIDNKILTANMLLELDMMYPGILKIINKSLFPEVVNVFFLDLVRNVLAQRNNTLSKRNDFMDLLLELRQKLEIQSTKRNDDENVTLEMTESVIAAQAFVFYVGGYETSATTMAYMLYQLALNPDIQDRVIEEIDEVLQKTKGEVTYDCLKEFTYLDKVFTETLRMYPVVEPLQRSARYDYRIPGTDVTVTKGQIVIASVLGIHYDEKHYPEPQKFDPDRFGPENSRDRHPCAYLPFGVGPRNCIGMRFGNIQSRLCVVKLLSKFRVEPSKNTNRDLKLHPCRLLNSPYGNINLNIVSRK